MPVVFPRQPITISHQTWSKEIASPSGFSCLRWNIGPHIMAIHAVVLRIQNKRWQRRIRRRRYPFMLIGMLCLIQWVFHYPLHINQQEQSMLSRTHQPELLLKLQILSLNLQHKQAQVFQHRRHIDNISDPVRLHSVGGYNVLHRIFRWYWKTVPTRHKLSCTTSILCFCDWIGCWVFIHQFVHRISGLFIVLLLDGEKEYGGWWIRWVIIEERGGIKN